jgi:hypothetical protein
MSGTSEGGKRAATTIKEKYGDMYYCLIGHMGGVKTGVTKGFAAMTPEKRAAAGAKGGRISRRGSNKKEAVVQ